MTVARTRLSTSALGLALVVGFALPACTGGTRRSARSGDPVTGDPASRRSRTGEGGEVFVSDQELAPMDSWIRRRRWILADEIEIDASREYFSQYVSVATRIGIVQKDITESSGVTTTVLTFSGRPEDLDVASAPRVLVGTGITASARRRLVLRLHKTTNPDLPVRFRLVARGKATTGVGDQVTGRAPELGMGASLRRAPGGYVFEEH